MCRYFSIKTNKNLISKRKKRLTATERIFKQDYTDLFAEPEEITLKILLGRKIFRYIKVAGDIHRKKLPVEVRTMLMIVI